MQIFNFFKSKLATFQNIHPFWGIYLFFGFLGYKISYYTLPFFVQLLGLDVVSNHIKVLQITIFITIIFSFLRYSVFLINFILNTFIFQFIIITLFTFVNILLYLEDKLQLSIIRLFAFLFGLLPLVGPFLSSEKLFGLITPNYDYFFFLLFLLNIFIKFNKVVLILFLSPHLIFLDFTKKERFYWCDICELIKYGFENKFFLCPLSNEFVVHNFLLENKLKYQFFRGFFVCFPIGEKDLKRLRDIDNLLDKEKNDLLFNTLPIEKKNKFTKFQSTLEKRNEDIKAISVNVKDYALRTNTVVYWHFIQGLFLSFLISLFLLN